MTATRAVIIIDVHDEPVIAVAVWARQSAHHLTRQLGDHGVIAHVARVEIDTTPRPDSSGDPDAENPSPSDTKTDHSPSQSPSTRADAR
jgi:hypothetical protein